MVNEKKFGWGELILGILFIIIAMFSFSNPEKTLKAFVVLFGIGAIIKGVFSLLSYSKLKELSGIHAGSLVLVGILDILLGLLLVTNLYSGIFVFAVMFAIWFLVDSIASLINIGYLRERHTPLFIFTLVLNIICVFIGLSLLFNPISSALTLSFLVGFYFMMFGIEMVVLAFHRF